MPQFKVPGMNVEETSFRFKPIEGVSTSITAFIGPTRRGPVGESLKAITSMREFENIYGSMHDLTVAPKTNYLAQAARAFFAEGGRELHVIRVAGGQKAAARNNLVARKKSRFVARFPCDAGNGRVRVSVAKKPVTKDSLSTTVEGSLVEIAKSNPEFAVKINGVWRDATSLRKRKDPSSDSAPINVITLSVNMTDKDGLTAEFSGLGLHKAHPYFIGKAFQPGGIDPDDHRSRVFALELASTVTPLELYSAIAFPNKGNPDDRPSIIFDLIGGTDEIPADWQTSFQAMAGLPDVSIIAAPGSTEFAAGLAAHVRSHLIVQAEADQSYRVVVLDVPKAQSPASTLAYKAGIDSKNAALYFPWVVVANPLAVNSPPAVSSSVELTLPPSGFVCGIFARVDHSRGVFKAPANETIQGALRLEYAITDAEQETLNPAGVNSLRFFTGRGVLVWAAHTTSSDPEWKYINIRRYLIYLEQSIDEGTRWAVFEPNGEALWIKMRDAIDNFLLNEWRQGALQGTKPDQAFFVRCDRTTMTQSDIDQGRLICLVGVALVKPAEFVSFRIARKTTD